MFLCNFILLSHQAAMAGATQETSVAAPLSVSEIRCESQIDPVGIGTAKPALSWIVESPQRAQKLSGWQVLAASRPELLTPEEADLWNSSKEKSGQSIHVTYDGKPLKSGQRVFWKVRVWNEAGAQSDWSRAGTFTTALLSDSDWSARWIGSGVPLLRKEVPLESGSWICYREKGQGTEIAPRVLPGTRRFFRRKIETASEAPASAILTIAADTEAEIWMNGEYVGRATHPEEASQFDVRQLLRPGEKNLLAVEVTKIALTPGPLGLLAHLTMHAQDGTSATLATDAKWMSAENAEGEKWKLPQEDPPGEWQPAHAIKEFSIEPWGRVLPPDAHRPLPIFRREFEIEKPVRHAVVHVCGLGQYNLYLDGKLAHDEFLDPPWSQYEKTVYYSSHDITDFLREKGAHAFGVMLGKGWYHNRGNRRVHGRVYERPLTLILQAHIEFEDGTSQTISTDSEWKWVEGPILHDAIVGGVDYDASRLPDGWCEAGFDDSDWERCREMLPPEGRLAARISPPLRSFERFAPKSIEEPEPGFFVYNFGQNASALPFLRVEGKTGQKLRLTYSEQRHGSTDDRNDGKGRVDQSGIGTPGYLEYTLQGGGEESWLPRTFYTGYQYLELTGAVPEGFPNPNGLPVVKELTSVHVRSGAETVGGFQCSEPLIMEIDRMIDWAIRSNLSHVLTDCPHREKLGWLEVPYLMWDSIVFRYDWSQMGPKIARDIRDAQQPDGKVFTTAPTYGDFPNDFQYTPEWGAASVFVPWFSYQWYGNARVLEENFDCMRGFVDYMHKTATELVPKPGLGDWFDYGHDQDLGPSRFTPTELTAMATFYACANVVANAARTLGLRDEAEKYDSLARSIRAEFNRRFFDGKAEYQNNGSPQTANAIALCTGLVDEEHKAAVLDRIVQDLEKRNFQQTSGDVGFHYLVRALADGGRSDVLYKIAMRTDKGSYGHLLQAGWTSLPESWNAARFASMNHCMLGHILEWLQGGLGGIQPDGKTPGLKRFRIAPALVDGISSASAFHRSPYGRISSAWEVQDGRMEIEVEAPVNTACELHLPAADADGVREGETDARKAEGVQFLRTENGRAVFEVGSGRYHFSSSIPATAASAN